MKFLVDLTCEGGALLFYSLIRRLQEKGHEVYITSRHYDKANELQKSLGLKASIIGRHGGASLYGKLRAYALRVERLADYLIEHNVDAVVSNAGPEICRVGYGLGLKVFTWNDMPEAEAQTRLTVPLSTWVFTPWIIPKEEFTKYGISGGHIYQYPALYPMAWLPNIKVDDKIVQKLALSSENPIILFRESEGRAAYLLDKKSIVLSAVRTLAEKHRGWQFISRARYDAGELKSELKDLPNTYIFDEPIDMQSLLAKADFLIGGGATMNIEAAYYGTPVIACRQIEVRYERFLIQAGLAIKAHSDRHIVELAERVLGNRNDDLARRVFGRMHYPLEEIIEIMEE